ncbi:MAG: RsbRD N-terminal domain-containing protein [Desulfamplus sp.]|nr:RsbRD N-terminal domain-containing protein [Desulfamplus sp.]
MEFHGLMEKSRGHIFDRWFDAAIKSYPQDTARIFLKSGNRFDNPVGSATKQSLQDTLDLIFGSLSHAPSPPVIDGMAVERALDPVIRIRAVQGFLPSRAVGFVFELKDIVKSLLDHPQGRSLGMGLNEEFSGDIFAESEFFFTIVDQVALAAFDRFMKCREDIFLLRANESKRRIHRAFERAGLVTELVEEGLPGS